MGVCVGSHPIICEHIGKETDFAQTPTVPVQLSIFPLGGDSPIGMSADAASDTIISVKERLSQMLDKPSALIHLVIDEKPLEDSATFLQCGVDSSAPVALSMVFLSEARQCKTVTQSQHTKAIFTRTENGDKVVCELTYDDLEVPSMADQVVIDLVEATCRCKILRPGSEGLVGCSLVWSGPIQEGLPYGHGGCDLVDSEKERLCESLAYDSDGYKMHALSHDWRIDGTVGDKEFRNVSPAISPGESLQLRVGVLRPDFRAFGCESDFGEMTVHYRWTTSLS